MATVSSGDNLVCFDQIDLNDVTVSSGSELLCSKADSRCSKSN